ncbi:hypothetical protein CK203_022093 [Vitis vinifera]|uniref:Uncharacterized protein n=1 Tax=Vitis vinifera TaxID=29760 RepID=A0A438FZU1_VITVI|nr:hypothetical protein CK203_022093 [Vitis vinifera]
MVDGEELGRKQSHISLYLKSSQHHLHKPHFSCSLSLLFFSSSGPQKKKPAIPVSTADYLIKRHQFSQETALTAASTHLEKTVKRVPRVLSANLDKTIKPKIKIFQDLGCTPTDIAYIISQDPWILNRSANNGLMPSIVALQSVMGSNSDVSKVLKICARFLKHDLGKTLKPNIEFMKSCGISTSQIKKVVFSFPRFLLHKPESIKDSVRRVDEMGCDRKSKMYLHAIRNLSSMTLENWELKLKLFRSLGFSENEIVTSFRKAPQVFALSERKIIEGTRFLLTVGNSDMSYLVNHAELLIFSIEKRLKPRFRVLEFLQGKNLLPKRPSVTTICKISNKQFIGKYVLPYSNEVGDLYMVKEDGMGKAVKRRWR